jgi:hypothetical protein
VSRKQMSEYREKVAKVVKEINSEVVCGGDNWNFKSTSYCISLSYENKETTAEFSKELLEDTDRSGELRNKVKGYILRIKSGGCF